MSLSTSPTHFDDHFVKVVNEVPSERLNLRTRMLKPSADPLRFRVQSIGSAKLSARHSGGLDHSTNLKRDFFVFAGNFDHRQANWIKALASLEVPQNFADKGDGSGAVSPNHGNHALDESIAAVMIQPSQELRFVPSTGPIRCLAPAAHAVVDRGDISSELHFQAMPMLRHSLVAVFCARR